MNAFEITTLFHNDVVSTAEADSAEAALLAGQTMFDDALSANPYQGSQRSTSTRFFVDGKHVRTIVGHRPS